MMTEYLFYNKIKIKINEIFLKFRGDIFYII